MANNNSNSNAWNNKSIQRMIGTDFGKEVNGSDVTASKLAAAYDCNSLWDKWQSRTKQVGSSDLPENFLDEITLNANMSIGSGSGSISPKSLTNDGKSLFNSGGKSQSKVFDEWLHKNLNMIGLMGDEETYSSIEKVHDYFDRYYSVYPDSELTNVYHYIFMTRPDCNLLNTDKTPWALREEVKRDPVIENIYHTRPHVLRNLISSGSSSKTDPMYIPGKHRFMPMVTSRCDSLQISNTELRTSSLQQPYTKFTQHYGLHLANNTGIEFSMTFREFADLSIHYLMSGWMNYIHDIMKGIYNPKEMYVKFNRADYMVSIYDIMTAPDAKSILYWVKITGAFPVDNDNSGLSFNLHGSTSNQITVPFVAYRIEPIHPYSLIDFNFNTGLTNHNPSADINLCSPTHKDVMNKSRVSIIKRSDNPWESGYGTGYGLHARPFIFYNVNTRMYELGWLND